MNTTRPDKIWRQRPMPAGVDDNTCQVLAVELQLPPAIVQILLRRGFTDATAIRDFLNPTLHQLPPPSELKGMDSAVQIIVSAIKEKRPIAVFGDYDVDGISATALIVSFFNEIGIEIAYYIPDRFSDGYGLSSKGLKYLQEKTAVRDKGVGVLITVDCGISDFAAVTEARQMGFSVVVSDHHKPPPQLPLADAIINPLQQGCRFPFKQMSGVGVAFYLLMGLRTWLYKDGFWPAGSEPNLKKYLDLVAIGTVADLVPLKGINRIFVRAGLEIMAADQRPGLKSIFKAAKIHGRVVSAEDIAFRIAPRINAAGRTGRADKALELLITSSSEQAEELSRMLDEANEQRKDLEKKLYDRIFSQAEAEYQDGKKSLVLYGDDWHQGVIGIVAARLKEHFYRPTILLSIRESIAKGSGRSIDGLDLFRALSYCERLLLRYGGHEKAAGMSINANELNDFKNLFESYVDEILTDEDFVPVMSFDGDCSLRELLDSNFLSYYSQLAPFGAGNQEPIFINEKAKISSHFTVGDGKHLKIRLVENGFFVDGIGFGLGGIDSGLLEGKARFAFNLRLNSFKGESKWEINVQEINSINTMSTN